MKRVVALTLAVLLIPVAPVAAPAQDANAFAELRLRLNRGDTIIVTDTLGVATKGKVESVSRSALTIRTGKITRVFQQQDVVELQKAYRDEVGDGAKRGALVGMALGLAVGVKVSKSPGYVSESPGAPVGGALVGALFGALAGAVVDGMKDSNRTIYRAPGTPPARVRLVPFVSGAQKGAVLNISF